MRVDAAKARQAVEVAAQMHFGQPHLGDGAHRDLQNFAVPVEVDHDFPVQLLREAHEQAKQPVRQEEAAVEAYVVQLFHLSEHAFAKAQRISVYHSAS